MKLIEALIRYHILFFTGKVKFSKEGIGKLISEEDGKIFKVFLYVVYPEKMKAGFAKVKLRVRFRVKKLSLFQRAILPVVSTPFFAGCPGFISKRFMMCEESNTLQGDYQWENEQNVNHYLSSYALAFMRRISIPDSLEYDIIPCKNEK